MLELRGVSRSFDGKPALAELDLEVPVARTTVLLGPSGCGKSTILRLLIGLVAPDVGRVHFDGAEVRADAPSALAVLRRRMGYVIQDGGLFPHLDARGNVALLARHLGWDETRVEARLAKLCELTHFPIDGLDRFPVQLSGGQRQRVSLMRALMLDPDVLLLDEPLGALDYSLRQTMMVELKKIQRELGITFIMVTHSQQEALSMADKVIVMSDALVQQIGTSRDVYESPRTKFVAEFIGNNNLFSGKLVSCSGSMAFVERGGRLYYVRRPEFITDPPIGQEVSFSVRADLMHTGAREEMANQVEASYVASEFLGSLETDVFEVEKGLYVHVEQHRGASDRAYEIGETETISWPTDAGVLLI